MVLLLCAFAIPRIPLQKLTGSVTGERDFEDLKLLISHQKAKHFKCDRCGKRLNTAGGMQGIALGVTRPSLCPVAKA